MALTSFSQLRDIDFDADGENTQDNSGYRNYSKDIVITIGYLLGVKDEFLSTLSQPDIYPEFKAKYDKIADMKAIRHLNNIRSNLMLNFKNVSRTIRVDSPTYQPLYKMEMFEEDFKALGRLDVRITTGRSDINEYLQIINDEISKRINTVKSYIPDWVEFSYIRNMFKMPSNIKAESEKFQFHQNCYPYKRYFNWSNPQEVGNLLSTDYKLLTFVYEDNHAYFTEAGKVMDASDAVKNNINEFINRGNKIQVFVDGENADPYRFASMIDSLKDYEIDKIDKIVVYYDEIHTCRAWEMLKHFSDGIEVEPVPVERIKEDKSLVDHKLVAGVSKAVYRDDVDSVILVSSDSDFWAVIEDVSARYLVVVESDKCGHDFKEVLRNNNIFYCYMDKFMEIENNSFFNFVFRKELQSLIDKTASLPNANDLLGNAVLNSRADISKTEKENLFKKYIKGLTLNVDSDGNISIVVPE
ncbi:MAG: NYN domain-containing protein [Eubacteriales bacterium]|nr:NYN domain-containing protein [Eubacteriales bacterium]